MGLLSTMRAALVQASFNEKMANIVAKEIAYISFASAFGFWWLFGWQWFFLGLVLTPVFIVYGLRIPILKGIILGWIAVLWALPFIFLGSLGLYAGWCAAIIAFFFCFWAHTKAFQWSADNAATDDGQIW